MAKGMRELSIGHPPPTPGEVSTHLTSLSSEFKRLTIKEAQLELIGV